jgi:hypothetical protein
MLTSAWLLRRLGLLTVALSIFGLALYAQVSDRNAKVPLAVGGGESTFAFDWAPE